MITKKNNFEVEIWERIKNVLLYNFSFSHPARNIELHSENEVLIASSMTGQGTGCYLGENKTQVELLNYNPPAKIHKKSITYIDTNSFVCTYNLQSDKISKMGRRCLFLMKFKRKFRVR